MKPRRAVFPNAARVALEKSVSITDVHVREEYYDARTLFSPAKTSGRRHLWCSVSGSGGVRSAAARSIGPAFSTRATSRPVRSVEPFITGFLQNNEYIGRPVDVEVLKDGSLLISDDYAGAVYRVTYSGERTVKR
jgi:hypothetical protein